jgi:hypothetical protein
MRVRFNPKHMKHTKGRFYTREYANSSEDGIPFLKAIEPTTDSLPPTALRRVYSWSWSDLQGYRRGQIAIQLDDNLAEPHYVLAWVKHTS